MITKEDIKTQVIAERMAGVDAEIEKRYANLLEQRKLQNCGFLNNNLDEVLAAMEERNKRFMSPDRLLPSFEFDSEDRTIAPGRYSFRVGNAMFTDAYVYKCFYPDKGNEHYRCGSYNIMVVD